MYAVIVSMDLIEYCKYIFLYFFLKFPFLHKIVLPTVLLPLPWPTRRVTHAQIKCFRVVPQQMIY